MRPAVGRLLVAVALFAGWLGYLGYLVVCSPHAAGGRPLTLSRPQLLVSMLDVVARVEDDKGAVVVEEVLYPADGAPVKPGDRITVTNIDKCRAMPDPVVRNPEPPPDWSGPGSYILPLQFGPQKGERRFEVAPTPPSPGFPPNHTGAVGPPRIYPATPALRAEYRDVPKAK